MRGRVLAGERELLLERARAAASGKIVCFGRWVGDFGNPIDWQRNPLNRERWNADVHWTGSGRDASRVGDVKLTWEVARFPHAYLMTRAAAWHPDEADALAGGLAAQIEGFVSENPWEKGIHWSSGQETVFRLMAWLFAFDVLLSRSAAAARMRDVIGDAILAGASHVEDHVEYARRAVYNNHLLSEAVGLYLAGSLFHSSETGQRWLRLGSTILTEEAGRQFYTDGAYIQQSHNYHRLALQDLLWASLASHAIGHRPAPEWINALERSLDFLVAHQNPEDGRLPNHGSNDGALPSPLSSCDFADFRPTLQAVRLFTRGERLYEPGPWDEQAAWMLGPMTLEAPLRAPNRRSVSFEATGYHVLRGHDPATFAAFRCGSLRDRFSQIDMLHLDVW
jgi:asparagine synthase (glutamine-hydrolysing)